MTGAAGPAGVPQGGDRDGDRARAALPTEPDGLDLSRLARVGARLQGLRDAQGVSSDAFAAELQIPPALLEAIEAGRRDPTIPLLWRAADLLGISLSEFLSSVG